MNALARLAAHYGIEESFRDARGDVQVTTPAARQRLLAAMGVAVDSEESALQSLDTLERTHWLETVAPVQVVRENVPVSVPIIYAAGVDSVSWQLTLEGGEARSGQANFDSLALLLRREVDGQWREQRALVLDTAPLPAGYHRLTLGPGGAESMLIITPVRCWLPVEIERGERLWGVAAQLYLLKSNTNWGIGDFTDLRQLGQLLVENGAHALGLNPLHAMFADDPEHASPYSPASRLLLNVLNLDVEAVARASSNAKALERIRGQEFQLELRQCRERGSIDYTRVTALKMPILRQIFESWRSSREPSHGPEYEAFQRNRAKSFERSCLFLALRAHFACQSPALPDWRSWPADYQNPESAAVAQFASDHPDAVQFQVWLQYFADAQLGEAAKAVEPMIVGLYRDLAVGADTSGGETWGNQQAVITAAHVGAPPDIHNPAGQDWGLPPFHPMALKKEAYRSFIELLRANMRHAGGLRIDHVMALQQLYWVPQGASADQGAYVRYPREDLIGILALESHRNECLIVGEDLGTVPAGFRERMAEAGILSYRVLFFEKAGEEFIAPHGYPQLSLAVAGSHDLPTLAAWMTGSDLVLKEQLGLFPSAKLEKDARLNRYSDRQQLLTAFAERGLNADPAMSMHQFAESAHRFLASSVSAITMVQIDDITHEDRPVNVPATSTEHPNWRRRLSMSLEQIAEDPQFHALATLMNETRANSIRRPYDQPAGFSGST